MAYSLDQDEQMFAMFDKIASEPFVESSNYNEVRNPRPIVEATRSFEGRKVNLEAWGTEAAPKNNRTSKTGSAKQVTENDTVTATKTNGQVTKVVSDNASHEAKNEPAVKGGSFDAAAKSAASSQRSGADSKKKFEENCRYQKKCKMFKDFVSSLGVDAESSAAAAKIIRKFDELNKHARMEAASQPLNADSACEETSEPEDQA